MAAYLAWQLFDSLLVEVLRSLFLACFFQLSLLGLSVIAVAIGLFLSDFPVILPASPLRFPIPEFDQIAPRRVSYEAVLQVMCWNSAFLAVI